MLDICAWGSWVHRVEMKIVVVLFRLEAPKCDYDGDR